MEQPEWVKLVYSETPTKANVKQGYLYEDDLFFRVVGDTSETLVRKDKVISITKRTQRSSRASTRTSAQPRNNSSSRTSISARSLSSSRSSSANPTKTITKKNTRVKNYGTKRTRL